MLLLKTNKHHMTRSIPVEAGPGGHRTLIDIDVPQHYQDITVSHTSHDLHDILRPLQEGAPLKQESH
jgi:hypothetical protein